MDKIYKVEKISFYNFSIVAVETNLNFTDVPEEEIFDYTDFAEFKITLHNRQGKIIDFLKYVKNRNEKS